MDNKNVAKVINIRQLTNVKQAEKQSLNILSNSVNLSMLISKQTQRHIRNQTISQILSFSDLSLRVFQW